MKYYKNNDRDVVFDLYLNFSAQRAIQINLFSCKCWPVHNKWVYYFKLLFSLFQAIENRKKKIITETQEIAEAQK